MWFGSIRRVEYLAFKLSVMLSMRVRIITRGCLIITVAYDAIQVNSDSSSMEFNHFHVHMMVFDILPMYQRRRLVG